MTEAGGAARSFRWERRGLVFVPDGRYDWMQTHAQNPAVLALEDRLRIYFNCRPQRDAGGNVCAYPTFVDVDRRDPRRILAVHDRPLLELGELGTFDEFGAMGGSVIRAGDEVRLYYVGWNRCIGVPYNHAIGLAVSRDDGASFVRYGRGPIVGRSWNEPFIQNSPFVWHDGERFHMWYSTGLRWVRHGDAVEAIYVLTHATSFDGTVWERDGVPCVEPKLEDECQTNPSVLRIGGRFHLWFCYRCGTRFRNAERGYRIGYAWSDDLEKWHRDDELGALAPSPEPSWDSEMVAYPCVVEVDGRLLMFYSGNDFGRGGFGYAESAG